MTALENARCPVTVAAVVDAAKFGQSPEEQAHGMRTVQMLGPGVYSAPGPGNVGSHTKGLIRVFLHKERLNIELLIRIGWRRGGILPGLLSNAPEINVALPSPAFG
jgi:hypothetical protein